MEQKSSAAFADSKPHYELLDGLRGVAALLVIWYHVFEGFATSPFDQRFNHGYLAVDFFFILSGFVIGYAYDDRWNKTLTTRSFFKRRLIRLHPMVIIGVVLGVIMYLAQGCEKWDHTPVAMTWVMLAMLLNLFLIPTYPGAGAEIRGNGELFPLNGPSWSLFFEYIGNILYALMLRKLPTKGLTAIVALSGMGLTWFAVGNYSEYGHLGVGWTMADYNPIGGFLRLMFSFSCGLLLSRLFKPTNVKGAFWICSLTLLVLFAVPHVGGSAAPWKNGIYDSICVLFIFPALVWLGASGRTTDKASSRICKFLGDISYPIYIIHYPFMYFFYAWLWRDGLSFEETWPVALLLFFGNILLAFFFLKLYDEPLRKWLGKQK